MGAIASIKASALLNGNAVTTEAAVGPELTYVPEGFQPGGVAVWADQSGGKPVGYPTLSLAMRRPTKDSRLFKVTGRIDLPVLETPGSTVVGFEPPPTRAYSLQAHFEFICPERSSLAERQKLFSLVRSFLADNIEASDGSPTSATGSPIEDAVTTLAMPY